MFSASQDRAGKGMSLQTVGCRAPFQSQGDSCGVQTPSDCTHFRLDFLPTKSVDGERRAVETSVPIARQPGLVPGLWRWQRRNGA